MANAGEIRMGGAYVEIFADSGTLEGDLAKAKQHLDKFKKYESAEFKKFASSVGGLGASLKGSLSELGGIFPNLAGMLSPETIGLTALVAGAKEAVSTFRELGKQIGTISITTGFSPEFISRMSAALGGTDAFPILSKGMASFMMQLQAGSGESVAVAKSLGISFEQMKKMIPEERFKLLWNRVSSIKDETTRAGVAMRVFGEGAMQVLPALAKGQAYLDKWGNKADEYGAIISRADIAKVGKIGGAEKEASLAWTGTKTMVGRDLTNPFFSGLKKYAIITASGMWKAVTGRIAGEIYSEARSGGDINRWLALNWGARRFSDSEMAAGVERVKARRMAAFGEQDLGYLRQYNMDLAQKKVNRDLFVRTQRGWASNLLDGIEPRNYLQKRMDALFGNEDRENQIDSILGMSPQQRNMFLGMNALSKRKPNYFDADGNVTSRENAASAFVPKQQQDITTRISAMVPQSGTRLLENLGGLGIFSTGDVQKQQLDVQKESKRLLEQIARGKNAASYA